MGLIICVRVERTDIELENTIVIIVKYSVDKTKVRIKKLVEK